MPRPIVVTPTRANRRTIAAIGDSMTDNTTLGVPMEQEYPEVLASMLRATIASSTVQASPSPTSTTFSVAAGKGPTFRAGSPVRVGSQTGIIKSISGDAITLLSAITTPTAGQAVSQTPTYVKARNFGRSGNTTGTFSGSTVSQDMRSRFSAMTRYDVPDLGILYGGVNDSANGINQAATQANLEAMIASLLASGVPRVLLINVNYLNYSTGGDSTGLTEPAGAAFAQPFAAATAAVATYASSNPGQVALCDLWNYQRALVGGTVVMSGTSYSIADHADTTPTAGGFSWHVADSNQHHNALGHWIVATAVLRTILAQSGWLAALAG